MKDGAKFKRMGDMKPAVLLKALKEVLAEIAEAGEEVAGLAFSEEIVRHLVSAFSDAATRDDAIEAAEGHLGIEILADPRLTNESIILVEPKDIEAARESAARARAAPLSSETGATRLWICMDETAEKTVMLADLARTRQFSAASAVARSLSEDFGRMADDITRLAEVSAMEN